MKSIITITSTFVTIISMVIISSATQQGVSQEFPQTYAYTPNASVILEPLYIAKPQGTFIAIYSNSNQDEPFLVTEIDMRTLRQADQEKIMLGMPIYSKEDLTSFLEDFGT